MKRAPTAAGRKVAGAPESDKPAAAGISRADDPIWALMRKRADDLKAGGRPTPSEAANDLLVLGEILQMFDPVRRHQRNGRCVARRSSRRGGRSQVFSALIAPAPKLPEERGE